MAIARRHNRKQTYSIYWCTARDRSDDWFVVARSAEEACRFHESVEGLDPGSAAAEHVATLPGRRCGARGWKDPLDGAWTAGASWPSMALMRECGAVVENGSVRFGNRDYLAERKPGCRQHDAGTRELGWLSAIDGGKSA